jgi:HSP20 family protein
MLVAAISTKGLGQTMATDTDERRMTMTIERWDPFGEMLSLRDAMNRLLEESFVWPSRATTQLPSRMGPPIDLRETEDQYVLEAALPGVKPEDIDVSVQGNQVRIQAELKQDEEKKGERYHYRERRYGQFQRTITLPNNVKSDQVTSEFRNGLLTLTLPKAEEARPRRIQITGGEQPQQQMAGQAREVGQKT